jgi:tetratricopeptide (TPR) repeat protein
MSGHFDPERLVKAFIDFAQAATWSQSKDVLERHPELLDDEADAILRTLASAQRDEDTRTLVEEHHALLHLCRVVGVERAFAEKVRASQDYALPHEVHEDIRRAQEEEERYQRTGQRDALDAAIGAWKQALGHPAFSEAPGRLQLTLFNDAGATYLRRYWAKGELSDLDQAISLWQQAVDATPPDAPERAALLNSLGNGLGDRYARSGALEDLEQAIEFYQQAVDATPPDAPERATLLNNLGLVLSVRYARSGTFEDLEQALAVHQQAVASTPSDAPERATRLNNLGLVLSDRYARSGTLEDLEQAIEARQQAVDATPPDAPERTRYLNSLGNSLRVRYVRSGTLEDLEQALEAYQQAVALTPPDAPKRARYLSNLGLGLHDCYARSGALEDLEQAIAAHQQAVALTPPDAPGRAIYLNNLGGGLRDRYARSGTLEDLEQAIAAHQQAVDATPPDAPEWATLLNNLGLGLRDRYARSGTLEDLKAAIAACQQAVDLTSAESPGRAAIFNNLGNGLRDRYDRSGALEDLEQALAAHQQAVALTPPDAPERAKYLNNLGNGLSVRYDRSGAREDLEQALAAHQQAVDATPPDAPERAGRLSNLGSDLRDRYARSGTLEDLEQAIEFYQQAIEATPPDAPKRARYLSHLGVGLRDRYVRSGTLEDLEQALAALQQAMDATPPDAPERARYLSYLGVVLSDRYAHSSALEDLEAARSSHRGACDLGLKTALEGALGSARNWGNWALKRHAWKEAAEAYQYGSRAVERLLEVQLLRSAKETWLREAQGLAANAAYALARTREVDRAVETLEAGRARLLAEALERNRHDLEQLPARGQGELYARYRQASARWAALTNPDTEPTPEALPSGSDLRTARAETRAELDALVEEVRHVPGYENFLRAPTFDQIQATAVEAPLVYLMATAVGGLALIVSAIAEDAVRPAVQAVWLDVLTDAAVREQLRGPKDDPQLGGYLGAYGRWRDEPSSPEARTQWCNALESMTRWLWEALMSPLIETLGPVTLKASPMPGAVLIPTGLLGLLPLHAAWTEDDQTPSGRRYALDSLVFRYAPNARALTTAQVLTEQVSTERLLLCVEPQPVSASPLPAAEGEAIDILHYWPGGTTTDRWHQAVTRQELVEQLPQHSGLHFSGHAFAGWNEPAQGGLVLASDQILTVKELTTLQLRMRLVVLSACETGVPGLQLQDEVIGLPTALAEAGVAGVVASLWPVADKSTARLMAHFHRLWRKDKLVPPEALRRAQMALRDEGGYGHPFFWGAFTYTGV